MSGRNYVSAATRLKEGKLQLVEPLDYLILEKLPEEGTTLGGLVPLGETVRNLKSGEPFKQLPKAADTLGGRLRAMEVYGLVVNVVMPGETRGWQRTKLGEKHLTEWRKSNPAKEDK